jgi:hypothetical protein
MRYGLCLLLAMFAAIGARRAAGEAVWVEDPVDNANTTIRMEVTPADEPVPAFKYRLSLRPHEMVPGNSVLHYMRVFPEGGIDRTWKALHDKYGEEIDDWYGTSIPISQMPLEKARDAARSFDGTVDHIRLGSQSRDTDWGRGWENMEGPEIIAVLLPEIQASRSMARAVSLQTRVAIADRNYDQALDLMRMNYRLGQDVAVEPILVCSLVGVAICGVSNNNAIDLIAAPDSPNLYWALTDLPKPMISMRDAVRTELALGPRMFAFLNADDTMQLSPGEWNALWSKGIVSFLTSGVNDRPTDRQLAELAPMALGLAGYSHAKQRLVDWGYQPEKVEAMPVGQVLSLYSTRTYQVVANAMERAWHVPLEDAGSWERMADEYLDENRFGRGENRELLPVASMLLPAVSAVRSAGARLERDFAALQVIEALRMHAARNDGKWPQRLSDVTCVPVPDNPATGEPFMYELEGGTAILTLPKSDGFHIRRRYELTIAK